MMAYIPKDTLQLLYEKLPLDHRKSKDGTSIHSHLKALHVGDHFLDFTALASDGKTKNFSEVADNKYTLLVFGAAWCQPCKISRPELKEIHKVYKNRLTIVYHSADIKKETWLASIKTDALPYISFWDGGKSTLLAKYGFTSYPSMVLFDPNEKIIKLASGYSQGKYLNLIKEYLPGL